MPISSLTNPLTMTFLQQLLRRRSMGGGIAPDTIEVGGSFSFPRPSMAPPNNNILSAPLPQGAPTLNNVLQGTFTLPGNRGIQTQLLRMLSDPLHLNKPDIQFPGFATRPLELFP